MYHKIFRILSLFLVFLSGTSHAQVANCEVKDRTCILEQITKTAQAIENAAWKDQTLREVAKTYATDGAFDKALAIIEKIETPDTKALTIRGIGMAIATQKYTHEDKTDMYGKLRIEAEKITHPPSYAIALTYIAMAQAFAGDNDGAWKTASDMENAALRHKAYGETAEIQAEKGDYTAAQTSIEKIESAAFRNKAYTIVSKIFADKKLYSDAYEAARRITNPYKKAQSLQYILDAQKPRESKKK